MGVGVGVVFHLVIPGLDMEGRRTVSARERGRAREREKDREREIGNTDNSGTPDGAAR